MGRAVLPTAPMLARPMLATPMLATPMLATLMLVLATLGLAIAPSSASAHGRPPLVGAVAFHPTDPDVVVARATWGLVLTDDHGASWRWICAAVTGADPTRENPAILVMPDGAILVGTFDGLVRSTPDRCAFDPIDEDVTDVFVIDLDARRAEPGTVYAVVTSGVEPDQLVRSTDEGRSFEPVGDPVEDILLEKVRVAPSDPMRVYLSGAVPLDPTTMMRRGFFLRSRDGAETFERIEIPLEDGERNIHLLAVDPSDPDRVLVRVTRREIDDRPERLLLTENGGDTFTTALSIRELSGAAFSDDGSEAWATSRALDGLWRSPDGGRTFAQVLAGNHPCVGQRGGELWFCVDQLRDGYAMGRSDDGGDTVDRILFFEQITQLPECPRCSEVGYVCPEWFPDLAYDLMLDAGVPASLPDGGATGAPRDAAPPAICRDGAPVDLDAGLDAGMDGGTGPTSEGCGCRVGAPRRSATLPSILAALGLGLAIRRRGRAR